MTRDQKVGCLGLLALPLPFVVVLGTPFGWFLPVLVLLAGGCAVWARRSLPAMSPRDGLLWITIAMTALLLLLGARMVVYEEVAGIGLIIFAGFAFSVGLLLSGMLDG